MPKRKRKILHPLRRVVEIDVSEEMGAELGNPHYFWLDRRYTMTLECGHVQARVRYNPDHLPPAEFMPKRVRCKVCPGVSVPVKERPAPTYDHLASALVGSILGVGTEADEDIALGWVREHGKWIEPQAVRAATYGTVAVYLLDTMLDGRTVRHAEVLRETILKWSRRPNEKTRAQVRKVARRLYNVQHAEGNDWFTARALVCLGRIASMDHRSARGVVEALTWDRNTREGFYERLWTARHYLDHQSTQGLLVAGLEMDMGEREEALREIAEEAQEAKKELLRIWHDEYPQVGSYHLPLLLHLLSVFETAKQDAGMHTVSP